MLLKELKNKKLLILGFGKEGKDSFLALRKLFPQKIIGIADEKQIAKPDRKTIMYSGKNYLKALKRYDVIIKTPGIPLGKIRPFLKKGAKVTSQTEIFFDNFKGLIIGVTGTKGKGTTTSLIYQILKKAGKKAHLIGNIGKPVFRALLKAKEEDIFIYELSSHQLQGLKKSPQIAVFLNLYPDHLDYYRNLKEYSKAKENITKHQKKGDFFIYNADDVRVKQIAKKTKAKKTPVSLKTPITQFLRSLKLCYRLKGDFNVLNLKAALEAVKLLDIAEKPIEQAVKEFKGLPHRLELVGKYQGVEFYNDSMATIPEVTIAALSALGKKVTTLIVGGSEKGSNYTALAEKILKSAIKTLIFFPGTGEKIWQIVESKKPRDVKTKGFFAKSMKEAVKIAFRATNRGKVCLLSPAAASFNLFQDYKERGNLFKKWVKHYGCNHSKK